MGYHTTIPSIPSKKLHDSTQALQDALACGYRCTEEELMPLAHAISETCACLGCEQMPDLCGSTCSQ